ncbi:MAG: 3-dehydroquinate synthase [Gemmatimonadales bacterium]
MTIRVALPPPASGTGGDDASYDILIAGGLLDRLPTLLARHCPAAGYAIISDSRVAELYGARVEQAVRATGATAELFVFPAGEASKTRETWGRLGDRMLAARFGRDAAVVALGGGVVGDMAGFVAATYLRGIPWVQVPTSLLAMIDASIGGKTGVDVPAGKNLLGAFHQPRLVIIDLALLATLPAVQLSAGLAEAVKHGAIADAAYFDFLEREHAAILAGGPEALERVVRRSVEIKAAVVAADERERGRRAILNFGHTVAHALEATAKYAILHGEAVAIGMALEARLAERLGIAARGTADRITGVLKRLRLPVAPPTAPTPPDPLHPPDLPDLPDLPGALVEAMRSDKKVRAGTIRLALPTSIGEAWTDGAGGWTIPVDAVRLRELFRVGVNA